VLPKSSRAALQGMPRDWRIRMGADLIPEFITSGANAMSLQVILVRVTA